MSCDKILRYVHGLSCEQLMQDDKTFDAVAHNLEILGEASKHIPNQVRARYPEVEWPKIAGLRDVIAHEYFGIDEDILWDIIQNQVPALLGHVLRILNQEGKQA